MALPFVFRLSKADPLADEIQLPFVWSTVSICEALIVLLIFL